MSASKLDLRNNGKQKILFIGQTGSGKSALCNALSQSVRKGKKLPEKVFPESQSQMIGNTDTILKNVNFLGSKSKGISMIDTVGFNSTEMNDTEIAELIVSLKNNCDSVGLFAIVIKDPKRFEASLKETIELFEGMFGKKRFWKNAVVIITNLQQSKEQIERRAERVSDEEMILEFGHTVKSTFNIQTKVPTFIIDAHYDGSKKDERNNFTTSAENLYKLLMRSDPVSVSEIEKVTDKYQGLKELYERERKEKEELLERERKEEEERRIERSEERRRKVGLVKNIGLGVGAGTLAIGGIVASAVTRQPEFALSAVQFAGTMVSGIKPGDIFED